MRLNSKLFFLLSVIFIFSVGCMNMPTPPAQITGSYTSGLNYKDFTCEELAAEMASLARRQNQLVTAQEQRVKTRLEAMPSNILSSSTIDSENTRHWAIKVRFNSKTKKIPPWGESLQAYQLAFITTKYT